MTREQALEYLARLSEALGAEKLPGRLRHEPTAEEVRGALAWLRASLDELEKAVATR